MLPVKTVHVIVFANTQQEEESHGQTQQEAIYQAQQSSQEARGREQSLRKPFMMDSLDRKLKLVD